MCFNIVRSSELEFKRPLEVERCFKCCCWRCAIVSGSVVISVYALDWFR